MRRGGAESAEERKVGFWKKVRNRLITALGGINDESIAPENTDVISIGLESLIRVGAGEVGLDGSIKWRGDSIEDAKLRIRDTIAEELYDNGLIEYEESFNSIFGRAVTGYILAVDKSALSRLDEQRQKKEETK